MPFPAFLIEQTEVSESGSGKQFELDLLLDASSSFLVTLGITRVVEQESLDMTLQASPDSVTWSKKPILAFPQKFYTGTYQMILDLKAHPQARYIRPAWTLNRWGRGSLKPHFSLYLFIDTVAI